MRVMGPSLVVEEPRRHQSGFWLVTNGRFLKW